MSRAKMNTEKSIVEEHDLRPKISVIGVGGAGGNAVNNMIRAKLEGVEFIVANTDAQALEQSLVDKNRRIQLGLNITQGLGAGSKPDVGRASAEESIEEVIRFLSGSNMVFITAGMGGGTGTGAAPVIARAARESGILTIGVVTKPFHFEGTHRTRSADRGIDELQQYVDTLIIIPNQNLFRVANERTTFADAFKMADDVLYSGVRGVTDLMIMPGLINLDFADIRSVMAEMGKAMMGTGEAEGDRRALDAAEAAISNPLLDDVSMKGAKGVLINITGGYDMTLYEVDEAANRIRDDVESEANIIFGSTFDEKLNGKIRVSVVATGIGGSHPIANAWRQPGFSDVAQQLRETPIAPAARPPEPNHHITSDLNKELDGYTSSSEALNSPHSEDSQLDSMCDVLNLGDSMTLDEELEKPQDTSVFDDLPSVDYADSKQESAKFDSSLSQKTAAEKKRSISLFERFTGVSRNRIQQNAVTEHAENNTSSEFTRESKDSDLLEIPAFLRRGN